MPWRFPARVHAIHQGHGQIQNNYVGLQLCGLRHHLDAVGGLSTDLPTFARLQQCAKQLASRSIVIGNQQSQRQIITLLERKDARDQ